MMLCIMPGTDVQCSKGLKTDQFRAYRQKFYDLNNQSLMTENEAMGYPYNGASCYFPSTFSKGR